MDRSQQLARVPLFRGLSDAARVSLGDRLVERQFGPGELVFSKGDTGRAMFLLARGKVEIFLPAQGGAERVSLKEVGEDDYFGELALMDDKTRSASAQALSETVLLELSREHFVSDIVSSPEAVLAILGEMAMRLRDTNALLGQRAAKDAVKEFDENLGWGDRLADRVAELNGSWAFILGLLLLTFCWALLNSLSRQPFDAYPYQFFNLFLGILVGLQGPLIMMSQNRQSAKDRAQAATDFRVNLKNELGIEHLGRELVAFRREAEERMVELERAQIELVGRDGPAKPRPGRSGA